PPGVVERRRVAANPVRHLAAGTTRVPRSPTTTVVRRPPGTTPARRPARTAPVRRPVEPRPAATTADPPRAAPAGGDVGRPAEAGEPGSAVGASPGSVDRKSVV